MVGMFAISRAGHDKDRVYIIIKEEGDFVYLADGKARGLKNPKKKKKKHLQLMKTDIDTTLAEKLKSGHIIYEEEIKFAIKERTSGWQKNE